MTDAIDAMKKALDDTRGAFKVDSGVVDEVLRGAREKAQHRWIATNGEDLSGHDFGREEIWLWGRRFPGWAHVRHWMPAERTPEPPS